MLGRVQATGLVTTLTTSGNLSRLPENLIKPVYSTIEAGCLNVVRSFGFVPTVVSIIVGESDIEIKISSKLRASSSASDTTRKNSWLLEDSREMVEALRGFFQANYTPDGSYLVHVSLPLEHSRR